MICYCMCVIDCKLHTKYTMCYIVPDKCCPSSSWHFMALLLSDCPSSLLKLVMELTHTHCSWLPCCLLVYNLTFLLYFFSRSGMHGTNTDNVCMIVDFLRSCNQQVMMVKFCFLDSLWHHGTKNAHLTYT